jgi:hypothetical protein
MSYTRFGEDSDVYVIAMDVFEGERKTGKMQLCCYHKGIQPNFCTTNGGEMIEHLQKQKESGKKVPDAVFERIRAESERYGTWVYPTRKR